jgi:hypothetical protein
VDRTAAYRFGDAGYTKNQSTIGRQDPTGLEVKVEREICTLAAKAAAPENE